MHKIKKIKKLPTSGGHFFACLLTLRLIEILKGERFSLQNIKNSDAQTQMCNAQFSFKSLCPLCMSLHMCSVNEDLPRQYVRYMSDIQMCKLLCANCLASYCLHMFLCKRQAIRACSYLNIQHEQ